MIPSLDITRFMSTFQTAARSYLFYITPRLPYKNDFSTTYLVRASTLPSSSFEEIPTSMQQLDIKTAGKRQFDNWTVSFYVDKKAAIRIEFSKWLNLIVNPISGTHGYPSEYSLDQKVTLLGLDHTAIMTYTLVKAWPVSVGETPLDYGTTEYAQFDVSFAYQYYIVSGSSAAPKVM